MSFWTKIKKQVSRTGHKLGLDMNSTGWKATGSGMMAGMMAGALAAGPGGAFVGAYMGTAAGMAVGHELEEQEKAADEYQDSMNRIAAAAEAETVELTTNESQDVTNQNDDRAARLASAYSLSNTRSVTGKQLATSTSVKRSARGRSTLG